MVSLATTAHSKNRPWINPLMCGLMLAMLLAAAHVPLAHFNPVHAQEAESEADAPDDSDEMVMPEIPETVVVPDPVSLTIVLPKSGTIRQIVFTLWLEATSRQNVGVIEQRLPKVINAFLVDLQRLMYRDTQQRFETREPGKRGFKYVGPDLIPPPPPKTEEELEAEAEAAEAAKEAGEEIVKEPPFSPFAPVSNRYFAALQNRLLKVGQAQLPDDTLRSVQVRMFYDFWPGDRK